jgi:S-phase kinase-associated protein 1
VKLKSSQGEVFEVEEEVACMSQLVKTMVEDSGADEEIPLPNVKTAILGKVLDYCKFHKDEPPAEIQKPLKSANLAECGVREWDVDTSMWTRRSCSNSSSPPTTWTSSRSSI